jgi:hypothetical protein
VRSSTAADFTISAKAHASAREDEVLQRRGQGDKKGDERKAFVSSCLKAGAPAAPMTQQDKMKKCNADASAKALKGDERKGFMSECPSAWAWEPAWTRAD